VCSGSQNLAANHDAPLATRTDSGISLASRSFLQQQAKLDQFIYCYNFERSTPGPRHEMPG
jgi:hypothetical protein